MPVGEGGVPNVQADCPIFGTRFCKAVRCNGRHVATVLVIAVRQLCLATLLPVSAGCTPVKQKKLRFHWKSLKKELVLIVRAIIPGSIIQPSNHPAI